MDFAVAVNNDSTIRSARLDLVIDVPPIGASHYMCGEGNIQASFCYKNVTLVTSPTQRYYRFRSYKLMVSGFASEEDLSGEIGKKIMEAIKNRNEVRFGSRLTITDCKEDKKNGPMNFCSETALRFHPLSSEDQIKATSFGKHLSCKYQS